jgi:hypothetical protein
MGQEEMMTSHNKMNDGAKKGDFLGQEKLILGQYMTNYGTNKVTLKQEKLMLSHSETNYRTKLGHFWDRRRQNYIITRQNMGQNEVTCWDRRS